MIVIKNEDCSNIEKFPNRHVREKVAFQTIYIDHNWENTCMHVN